MHDTRANILLTVVILMKGIGSRVSRYFDNSRLFILVASRAAHLVFFDLTQEIFFDSSHCKLNTSQP